MYIGAIFKITFLTISEDRKWELWYQIESMVPNRLKHDREKGK